MKVEYEYLVGCEELQITLLPENDAERVMVGVITGRRFDTLTDLSDAGGVVFSTDSL